MTILNWMTSPERALVMTNTAIGTTTDSDIAEASKLHYLAHANMVISCRGNVLFSRVLYDYMQAHFAFYDEFAEQHFRTVLGVGYEKLLELAKRQQKIDQISATGQQVVLVGWSEKRAGFHATLGQVKMPGAVVEVNEMPQGISPWDSAWGDYPPIQTTPESMLSLAAKQVKLASAEYPECSFGGRIVLADMARGGASITCREI